MFHKVCSLKMNAPLKSASQSVANELQGYGTDVSCKYPISPSLSEVKTYTAQLPWYSSHPQTFFPNASSSLLGRCA